jgi:hypothetical protein
MPVLKVVRSTRLRGCGERQSIVGIVESMPCHLSELVRMSRQLKSRSSRAPFLLVGTVYSPEDDDARCLATLEGWLIDRTLCLKPLYLMAVAEACLRPFRSCISRMAINVLNSKDSLRHMSCFPAETA